MSTEGDLALRGHLAVSGGVSAYHNWYSVAHLVVKARDTAEHITGTRHPPWQRIIWLQISIAPGRRNPELDEWHHECGEH